MIVSLELRSISTSSDLVWLICQYRSQVGRKNLNLKVTMTHTVPMETPQSMLEEPSSGSKQTQYLNRDKKNARHDQRKQQYMTLWSLQVRFSDGLGLVTSNSEQYRGWQNWRTFRGGPGRRRWPPRSLQTQEHTVCTQAQSQCLNKFRTQVLKKETMLFYTNK